MTGVYTPPDQSHLVAVNGGASTHSTGMLSCFRKDFGGACELLILESQDLERHVNGAVLQLIVSTFRETVEPMDRLVRAALKPICSKLRSCVIINFFILVSLISNLSLIGCNESYNHGIFQSTHSNDRRPLSMRWKVNTSKKLQSNSLWIGIR